MALDRHLYHPLVEKSGESCTAHQPSAPSGTRAWCLEISVYKCGISTLFTQLSRSYKVHRHTASHSTDTRPDPITSQIPHIEPLTCLTPLYVGTALLESPPLPSPLFSPSSCAAYAGGASLRAGRITSLPSACSLYAGAASAMPASGSRTR
jgi:hypothetical protein